MRPILQPLGAALAAAFLLWPQSASPQGDDRAHSQRLMAALAVSGLWPSGGLYLLRSAGVDRSPSPSGSSMTTLSSQRPNL